jgi:hypothetical protein
MNLPFNYFNVSPSCRTPNPTNFYPHEPCSHYSSPYHSLGDCPHWGQFSNFLHEQMNTNFSSPKFELNSNFYNPDWNNHLDFSWQAHATENYAPQVDELHHPDYLQFDNQFSSHPSYDYPPKQSSLEEMLKKFTELVGQPTIPASYELSLEETLEEFRKTVNQPCQEIIDATMANTEAVARLEGQFGHLVTKFNRIEEEELQERAIGQYMIDEDCPSDPCHEHVQATTTFVGEERVGVDGVDNYEEEEEEMEKQIEPPPILNWSYDKEVSTEAHSFITIPLETYLEPQVSSFQCLEEPSYVGIFKKSHIKDHKSRNRVPKWIPRNKVKYIRWRNILPEGYQVLKKKGWKGLIGHPYEWGRYGIFPFLFSALHFLFIFFLLFYFLSFYFYFIQFLTAINFLFVLIRKRLLLVFDRCFDVQVRGTPWILHSLVPHPTIMYFLPHWGQCVI